MGTVELAIQTIRNLILDNLDDEIVLSGNVNKALRVMRSTYILVYANFIQKQS